MPRRLPDGHLVVLRADRAHLLQVLLAVAPLGQQGEEFDEVLLEARGREDGQHPRRRVVRGGGTRNDLDMPMAIRQDTHVVLRICSGKRGEMFGKPGRPPEDRLGRQYEIYQAVTPLLLAVGARRLSMRDAADAACMSIGGLY